MLLAETTIPDFVLAVQVLFGGVTAVLVIAYYSKQLFFAHPPEGKELVTEKRLEQANRQHEQGLKDFQIESREARQHLAEGTMELQRQLNADRDYAHTSVHKMQTDLQVQINRVALLEQRVEDTVTAWLKRVDGRLDHFDRSMSELGLRFGQLMGRLDRTLPPALSPREDALPEETHGV